MHSNTSKRSVSDEKAKFPSWTTRKEEQSSMKRYRQALDEVRIVIQRGRKQPSPKSKKIKRRRKRKKGKQILTSNNNFIK